MAFLPVKSALAQVPIWCYTTLESGDNMAPMSEAKKRANKKWNDANMSMRYDNVHLVLQKGLKAKIQAITSQSGESVNAFINRAIIAQIEKEVTSSAQNDA